MSSAKKPPHSVVSVTFKDGEVKEYRIAATPKIALWLSKNAGETGSLCLIGDSGAHIVPVENIREWSIVGATP